MIAVSPITGAGAEVNEKTGADGHARMYVNAGEVVRVSGYDAGNERQSNFAYL
jgi:hypothetical protein